MTRARTCLALATLATLSLAASTARAQSACAPLPLFQINNSPTEATSAIRCDHPDIVAKAQELATPLAMYQFVRNEIDYEVYYGQKKGALGTLWSGRGNDFDQASLMRWTIDTSGGGVKEEPLDDRSIEFPRIDPRREGLPHRFGYASTTDSSEGITTEHLVKYDLESKTSEIHDFGSGRTPSEAVFVPASADAAEDEGFLLTYVYDADRNSSDFVILDAQNIASEPLAIVPLPQRVPMGFHGNWIPDLG